IKPLLKRNPDPGGSAQNSAQSSGETGRYRSLAGQNKAEQLAGDVSFAEKLGRIAAAGCDGPLKQNAWMDRQHTPPRASNWSARYSRQTG
ncbi:MAG: hypothetical protein VW600_19295, partial [Ferrovibrio sp.]